jgi:hypothetical protein
LAIIASAQTFTGGSENRFQGINAFSDHDTNQRLIQNLNMERENDSSPFSSLTHNKALAYTSLIFNSYLENFSPDFLFISGDKNPVHNPGTIGGLFYIQILLLGLGLFYLVREKKTRELIFLIGWLLVAPTATAIILQTHFLRNAFMLPPLLIISNLGFYFLWSLRKVVNFNFVLWLVVIAFFIQFLVFSEELYFVAGQKFSRFWAYPAKVAVGKAQTEKNNYQNIFISAKIDSIEYGYPVYAQIDPNDVIKKTIQNIEGVNFEKYGNVYVGEIPDSNVEQFLSNVGNSYLYIGPIEQRSALHNYQTIDTDSGLPQLVLEKSN